MCRCEFGSLGASVVGSQGVLSASGLSEALGRVARGTGSSVRGEKGAKEAAGDGRTWKIKRKGRDKTIEYVINAYLREMHTSFELSFVNKGPTWGSS